MILSVFYDHIIQAAHQQNKPIRELLHAVRDMGYNMVEMHDEALQSDLSILDDLKDEGLGIASIYGFFRFDQSEEEAHCRALVELAMRAGAKRIMPIPGFYGEGDRTQALERMIAGTQHLTNLATQAGLTVTIEDFDNALSPIREVSGMKFFLDHIPNLGITFDTGNFRSCGENELDAYEALKDRIVHVHLKDRLLTDEYGPTELNAMDGTPLYPSPVGSGFVPIKAILQRLQADGYEGVLSVEHFGVRDLVDCMQKSIDFVRSVVEPALVV